MQPPNRARSIDAQPYGRLSGPHARASVPRTTATEPEDSSLLATPVADQVTRTGAQPRGPVCGVGELALLQGQAAAADAAGQPGTQALELGDAFVDPARP